MESVTSEDGVVVDSHLRGVMSDRLFYGGSKLPLIFISDVEELARLSV